MRASGKRTRCYQDVFCPNCGKPGQLKRKKDKLDNWYWNVDHYRKHKRIGGYHGKYSYVCYLGKYIVTLGKSTCYVIDHDTIVPPFEVNRMIYVGYQL